MDPRTTETVMELLQHGVTLHRQGFTAQAGGVYTKVVELDPAQPDALHLLGVVLTQSGDPVRGAALIQRSLELSPAQPVAIANLANAQLALQQWSIALDNYDRSIGFWPGYAPAHNGRGSALMGLRRPGEALASFERALELMPNLVEALDHRALALLKLSRFEEACLAFARILELRPEDAQALTNRALCCCALGHHNEALTDCDRALLIRPSFAEARYARGVALLGLGRFNKLLEESEGMPADAVYPEWLVLRGSAMRQLGRHADAMHAYCRALELRENYPEALAALGTLQTTERQFDQAAATFGRLLEIAPDEDFHRGVCLHAKLHVFDWSGYDETVQTILAELAAGHRPDLPFTFLSISDDPLYQQQCARRYCAARPAIVAKVTAVASPSAAATDSCLGANATERRRIRIAYISADFREHPMAFLLAGLFEAHDRTRFEIIAISLRADNLSATALRLRGAFDRFIDATGQADVEIARLISGLDVDIAVDLMGYTSEERAGILAARPAPIQVNYIGFPATMGCEYIDYIVADSFVIPPAAAAFYSECIAYLPRCFQANDARRPSITGRITRSEVGLPADGFVWCAFHASVKINPPLFDVWARLLCAVPDSVLWLISNSDASEENLRREALRRGVHPERLVFAKREPYPQHLARLGLADLCLDTWPFNGGATTSDALWRSVPVVTRAGLAFSSRMSGSLLHAAGLPELVTETFADYERVAYGLATNQAALKGVRSRLREARARGSLFDTESYRRYLEAAYIRMWERQQRGDAPATFFVPLEQDDRG